MRLFRLIRCGSLPGSDCPHRFVRDHNIRHLLGGHAVQSACHLPIEHFVRFARFAFFEEFTDDDPAAARFFAGGQGDRVMFDLPGYSIERLRRAGLGGAEWIRHCTYADPARFFSYRRATHLKEPDYGRLIAAIRL